MWIDSYLSFEEKLLQEPTLLNIQNLTIRQRLASETACHKHADQKNISQTNVHNGK